MNKPDVIAAAEPPLDCRVMPADDGWPKLDKPARVGNGTFGAGISCRLVIEAAQRAHQYAGEHRDLTPEQAREAERNRRKLWDRLNGPIGA